MRVSFITTVFNEENSIVEFLDSVFKQSRMPDEIVIVDGGSRDKTVNRIKKQELRIKNKSIKFKLIIKKGNRSVGRNEAIRQASGDIIACSDSGNILDKNWIKNIIKPFSDKKTDVAAGYYRAKAENIFQKCLTPYVLVMPDQVNDKEFLPATRSVAFSKSIWEKSGGFDERLSHNEDYAFATKLRKIGAKIVFCKDAIVNWIPRKNLKDTFVMFFRFAYGDIEANILRTKVILLFARYLLAFYLVFLSVFYKSLPGIILVGFLTVIYLIWAVYKNYRYINNIHALYLLPAIQFTADFAVVSGSTAGFFKRLMSIDFAAYIKAHKFLISVIGVYVLVLISTISYGVPNESRPFPFHMDEWHQLQAVANTYRYGTPNVFGSANGTMFHFLYSGLYVVPFWITGYINPFELTINNGFMRERVFEVLRLQTILFGAFSIFVFYEIASRLRLAKKTSVLLFSTAPVWIVLSGFFKYDIALIFWILLTLFFLILYATKSSNKYIYYASFFCACAFAVKVSAIPLVLIIALAYLMFENKFFRNIRVLVAAGLVFLITAVLLGMPDTIFGRGNILHFLGENIVSGPATSSNLLLGMNSYLYVFVKNHILIFGGGLWILFLSAILFWIVSVFKTGLKHFYKTNKLFVFVILSYLIFAISLLPLKAYAVGNRSLVLLPFMILVVGFFIKKVSEHRGIQKFIYVLLGAVLAIQIYQSYLLQSVKAQPATQEKSSEWILSNLPKKSIIGIENIPIYQGLPDIALKEFYYKEYQLKRDYNFRYVVLSDRVVENPDYIVLTNDHIIKNLITGSTQEKLLKDMDRNKYKKIYSTDTQLSKYFFGFFDDRDLYFSGLLVQPLRISIYKKEVYN